MLEKDFSSDWFSAILGNLRDNDYLTQSDVDVLLKDSLENRSIDLANIAREKAEIVRNALLENSKRKRFK